MILRDKQFEIYRVWFYPTMLTTIDFESELPL